MSDVDKDAKSNPTPHSSHGKTTAAPGRSNVRSRYGQGGAPSAPAGPASQPPPAPSSPPAAKPDDDSEGTSDDEPATSTFDSAFDLGGQSGAAHPAKTDHEPEEEGEARWLQHRPAPGSQRGTPISGGDPVSQSESEVQGAEDDESDDSSR